MYCDQTKFLSFVSNKGLLAFGGEMAIHGSVGMGMKTSTKLMRVQMENNKPFGYNSTFQEGPTLCRPPSHSEGRRHSTPVITSGTLMAFSPNVSPSW